MDREALKGLEFHRVLEEIARHCHSDVTRGLVRDILPLNDISLIHERFGQVGEILRLRDEGYPLNLYEFYDISEIIEKVRPEAATLDAGMLLHLLSVLRLIEEVWEVLKRNDLVYLRPLSDGLSGFPLIRSKIEETIDSEGRILDSASPILSEIRHKRISLEKRIKKRLEELVKDKRITPFLQDNFISTRSGRWVIPVRMDSKGDVKGIVHDVSRSGDTAFIEPLEIIGLSNELENIVAEERVEELRILRGISNLIRAEAKEIDRQFRVLVMIDLLNSIAIFSEMTRARIPEIKGSNFLRLHGARHPLLLISRPFEEVVPLDIEVGETDRVVVITGPNAGGKTVTVKTVGLLTAMALSGIPIPANASSSIPLLENIYVDIGDEQSIVDNLSTFSGHIRRISEILSRTGDRDMVILDELGTGTDPSQGSSIGCAILEDLRDRGAFVFATTHLIDIVGFVYSSQGMVNASMEFDQKTLRPLYRLKMGEPGESHAFEIASRYGLPEEIIKKARERLGRSEDFYRLIDDLKDKRDRYERLIMEEQERIKGLREKEERIRDIFTQLEKEKREILRKAYEEARSIVVDTERRLKSMMEEMRVRGPRSVANEIFEINREMEERIRDLSNEPMMDIDEIKEGDTVFIRSIGEDLKVIRVLRERKAVKVRFKNMEVEVDQREIFPPRGSNFKRKEEVSVDGGDAIERELNIIGLRVDEALGKLESFLNHAFLSGLREVKVIHGVGKGLLLRAVREYLEGHELVEDFGPAGDVSRGDGVTKIRMVPKA